MGTAQEDTNGTEIARPERGGRPMMRAEELRAAFIAFFAARGHEVVPSASVVPADRSVMFTIAGMIPFKSYFTGEIDPPWPRAASSQRCFRTVDIDEVGVSSRHLTFFEMLGNFSFGDYFKELAIPMAWEFVTEELGLEPDRLWATVHRSDAESSAIWKGSTGLLPERVQEMGDEENFWRMGETGPCGPSSELYFDTLGTSTDAGPLGGSEGRYVELWNLVFTQYDRGPDGSLQPLPRKNIDTGMGLERTLAAIQGARSVFDTDLFAPMLAVAERLLSRRYGKSDEDDVAIRRLADHGRGMTVLVADGVLPSNEGRGYVLRRLVRRAVVAARRLGVESPVTPELVAASVEVLKGAWVELPGRAELVTEVLEREEASFDRTLRSGMSILTHELEAARSGTSILGGEVAFRLHDTHGFPIELTEELAAEAGVTVDSAGFAASMQEQRSRARSAAHAPAVASESAYRALLEEVGETTFLGRDPGSYAIATKVIGVLDGGEPPLLEVFLESSPFYAQGGGQVGDHGTIVTETGRAQVFDTVEVIAGLSAHRARVQGEIHVGQDAMAAIDVTRREATARNHTGTHLLHGALREVLGDHVRQQGSNVGPNRLRFDFSHHGAPSAAELCAVLEMANRDVMADSVVETTETTLALAHTHGALAFFGDTYGAVVRMVRAGPHSLELCGGTHVHALGAIGPIAMLSVGSIGSNTRRIEAVTGAEAVERNIAQDASLKEAARLLRTEPGGVLEALERLVELARSHERELTEMRRGAMVAQARELAAGAQDGAIVARLDDRSAEELRTVAQAALRDGRLRAAVLAGTVDSKVVLCVATLGDPDATALARQMAAQLGGSGGGSAELAVAGGRDASKIAQALDLARSALGLPAR
ncbi:MAG: alanine--tRNA ligase [Acidimicrobiales bacterium]